MSIRVKVAAAILAAISAWGATPVSAAPNETGASGPTFGADWVRVQGGSSSSELAAYLSTLPRAERAAFLATQVPFAVRETAIVEPSAAPAAASSESSLTVLATTSCWTVRVNGEAKALAGNTLYTYYHVGGWCASGSTVTSAWVAANGGETSTPGWNYVGVIGSSSAVISNQGRSYSQIKFEFGAGGWILQSPTHCLRVNGYSSGGYGYSSTCGVY